MLWLSSFSFIGVSHRHFMQVWPNFISATERNIICVWVCRELQPLLGLLLMRDCHSWVYSLKVDVARKSASQQINQSFSPKYQKAPGWEKNPSDGRVYHGNSCSVEGHKNWHSPHRMNCNLPGSGVVCDMLLRTCRSCIYIYTQSSSDCFDIEQQHISINVYKKTMRGMWCFQVHGLTTW